ncbi:MAG: 50S ribosomal protein L25 [Candidatus Manganitrophus sp. SB1]|nr:50S ribosomal protein L25 [Candidatus Manganitrophus morganii]
MQKIEIQSEFRKEAGKGVARQLRMRGKIPAVLYGAGASTLLTMDPKDINKVLHSASGENTLITLQITGGSGEESRVAILRDFQRDPITGKVLHADLFEINMNEPIVVKVPVEVTGTVSVGVKEGGVLQHNLREMEIRCLPSLIPDHIQVDASALAIGESVHAKDIRLAEGIEVMTDPDQVVVSVAAPISEAKLEELLTAPKEIKEPEVLTKKEGEEAPKAEGGKGEAKAGEAKAKPEAKGKEEKKETKK